MVTEAQISSKKRTKAGTLDWGLHENQRLIICFEDITDNSQTEWSVTLAGYTGIEQTRLLSGRDRLLKMRRLTNQQEMTFIDKAMDDRLNSIYTALQNARNRVFEIGS